MQGREGGENRGLILALILSRIENSGTEEQDKEYIMGITALCNSTTHQERKRKVQNTMHGFPLPHFRVRSYDKTRHY